jgi:hypothetical protein
MRVSNKSAALAMIGNFASLLRRILWGAVGFVIALALAMAIIWWLMTYVA